MKSNRKKPKYFGLLCEQFRLVWKNKKQLHVIFFVFAASCCPTLAIESYLIRVTQHNPDTSTLSLEEPVILSLYGSLSVILFAVQAMVLTWTHHRKTSRIYIKLFIYFLLLSSVVIGSIAMFARSAVSKEYLFVLYLVLVNFAEAFVMTPLVGVFSEVVKRGQESIAINLMSSIYNIATLVSRFSLTFQDQATDFALYESDFERFTIPAIINSVFSASCIIYFYLFFKL